jgi:hypothetical protein
MHRPPRLLRTFLLALLAVTAPSLACGPRGAAMTPELIDTAGAHTFDAPLAATFEATIGALKTLGYEIAVANPEKGSIKTGRKYLRSHGQASTVGGPYGATSTVAVTDASRQYYITLSAEGDARTRVVAAPKVFMGNNDISNQEVWALEGPNGEHELWKQLFAEIQSNL